MKPVYLLDTNVISEFSKPKPNLNVLQRLRRVEHLCAICSTVWEEVVFGYERLPDGKRKQTLRQYVEKIKSTYDIIPYDCFASQICGEIRTKCEKIGKPAPFYDSQIASTAIANNMILITRNTQEYTEFAKGTMLKVESWWA